MKYHRITTIAGLVLGTAALTATAANAVIFNPGRGAREVTLARRFLVDPNEWCLTAPPGGLT